MRPSGAILDHCSRFGAGVAVSVSRRAPPLLAPADPCTVHNGRPPLSIRRMSHPRRSPGSVRRSPRLSIRHMRPSSAMLDHRSRFGAGLALAGHPARCADRPASRSDRCGHRERSSPPLSIRRRSRPRRSPGSVRQSHRLSSRQIARRAQWSTAALDSAHVSPSPVTQVGAPIAPSLDPLLDPAYASIERDARPPLSIRRISCPRRSPSRRGEHIARDLSDAALAPSTRWPPSIQRMSPRGPPSARRSRRSRPGACLH
jgi:hypothetical protein